MGRVVNLAVTQNKQITINHMKAGQKGTVVEFLGGKGLARRLQSLGIRIGKKITNVSSMFMRGPVTVKVDGTQVAIGFGMAQKILVSLEDE